MPQMKGKILKLFLVISMVITLGLPALAAEFPTKPVVLVVPLAAGGPVDLTSRALANACKASLDQPIICENIPGGGCTVGFTLASKKPPDGYTLVIPTSHSVNAAWHMGLLQVHPVDSVTPIVRISGILNGLVVRADSPWKTMQEFVQYAKQNPGKISYGTGGLGHPPHLAMEELALTAGGIQWTHVPYKGVSEAITAVLGGHVEAACGGSSWAPLVDAGKLRLLVVFTPIRSSRYPQAPTLKDIGYDIAYASPVDILGPKGISKTIVTKLHDTFKKAMDDSEFQAVLNKMDMIPIYLSSEELAKTSRQEFEQVGKMVVKLGLQPKK